MAEDANTDQKARRFCEIAYDQGLLKERHAAKLLKRHKGYADKGIAMRIDEVAVELGLLTPAQCTAVGKALRGKKRTDAKKSRSGARGSRTASRSGTRRSSTTKRSGTRRSGTAKRSGTRRSGTAKRSGTRRSGTAKRSGTRRSGTANRSGARRSGAGGSSTNELRLPCRLGNFKVFEFLGGDMGAVYKAFDLERSSWVALKILPTTLQSNTESSGRFQREADAAKGLLHPNLVRFYDTGQLAGRQYISMEFINGHSLETVLQKVVKMEEVAALRTARGIGSGLLHLHTNGIIHRDLKPANVMLDRHGKVRVSDLGLSKLLKDQQSLTLTGFIVGTPTYMAPEMAMGLPDVDHRADIYSLGLCLYEMLCGHPPFDGRIDEVLKSQIEEDVPDPRSVVKEVSETTAILIREMTQKDPEERPQGLGAVIAGIDMILKEAGTPRK